MSDKTNIDKQEPVAWMFPCDIKRFMETETNGVAYSVSMGHPDKGSTEPLYTSPPTSSDNEVFEKAQEFLGYCYKDGAFEPAFHYMKELRELHEAKLGEKG